MPIDKINRFKMSFRKSFSFSKFLEFKFKNAKRDYYTNKIENDFCYQFLKVIQIIDINKSLCK